MGLVLQLVRSPHLRQLHSRWSLCYVRDVEAYLHFLISNLQSDLLATVLSQFRTICNTDVFLSVTRLERKIKEVLRSTSKPVRTSVDQELSIPLQCQGRACRVELRTRMWDLEHCIRASGLEWRCPWPILSQSLHHGTHHFLSPSSENSSTWVAALLFFCFFFDDVLLDTGASWCDPVLSCLGQRQHSQRECQRSHSSSELHKNIEAVGQNT